MSNHARKFYGTKYPGDVPAHIVNRRVEATDEKEYNRWLLKTISVGAAIVALTTLVGKNTIDFNRSHSDYPPVTNTHDDALPESQK